MRYSADDHRRYDFREWLRSEMRSLGFYSATTQHYLVSEFVRQARSLGAELTPASMDRYLRDEQPELPTPATCRELAIALGCHPVEALLAAGYSELGDFLEVREADE